MIGIQPTERGGNQKSSHPRETKLTLWAVVATLFGSMAKIFAPKKLSLDIDTRLRELTDTGVNANISKEEFNNKLREVKTIREFRTFCRRYNTKTLCDRGVISKETRRALDTLYLSLKKFRPEVFERTRIWEIWMEKKQGHALPEISDSFHNPAEVIVIKRLCEQISCNPNVFLEGMPIDFKKEMEIAEQQKIIRKGLFDMAFDSEMIRHFTAIGKQSFDPNLNPITREQWIQKARNPATRFTDAKLQHVDSWVNYIKLVKEMGAADENWKVVMNTNMEEAGGKGFLGGKEFSYSSRKIDEKLKPLVNSS